MKIVLYGVKRATFRIMTFEYQRRSLVRPRRNVPRYSAQWLKTEVEVRKRMLLAALGCGRLPRILEIAARHSVVVFGTMEGNALAGLPVSVAGPTAPAVPVYFYETG